MFLDSNRRIAAALFAMLSDVTICATCAQAETLGADSQPNPTFLSSHLDKTVKTVPGLLLFSRISNT
ncbi:hypothetical protein BgiMline_025673, partial [Biomphalaria glabrata]